MTRSHDPAEAVNAPRPIAEVWSIAWPSVLTMTSYTVMQFVDKLMVGRVGPLEVAAQGNGGIWAFAPIAIILGVLTVVNTWVAQNLGAGTPRNGPKYAWAAGWLSLWIWLGVLVPLAFAMPAIFGAIHTGPELLRLETQYAQILLGGGVLTLLGRSMHHFFFGLHRPKVVTASAIAANIVNVVANYVLIFGADGVPALGLPGVPGVPALGLAGAAIGTLIGTLVEVAVPVAVFLGPRLDAELGTRAAWRPRWHPIRDLLRLGWPASIQFGNEIVCWAIFMTILVGQFGAEHMAAGWIALGYMHLSFMPALGFSVATTSLVGRYQGAGRPDLALARARLALAMAMTYMTLCAALFVIFRGPLIALFVAGAEDVERAAEIIRIGRALLICAAVFQTFDAIGVVYAGALRGAGDVIWPGVVTVVYSWVLIVGGGLVAIRYLPQLESIGPWVAAAIYISLFGLTMGARFESGRWRSIRLVESGSGDPGRGRASRTAPIGPAPPATDPEGSGRDRLDDVPDGGSRTGVPLD